MLSVKVFTEDLHCGSEIAGVVYLNTDKEYRFCGVNLDLVGKEKTSQTKIKMVPAGTHTHGQQNVSQPTTETLHLHQSKEFLHLKKVLLIPSYPPNDFDGYSQLPPGRYELPFTMLLPDKLPPTAHYKKIAEIKYYIKAKMSTKAKGFKESAMQLFSSGLKAELKLDIPGSISREDLETYGGPSKFRNAKKFTFSRGKGELVFHGSIPQSLFRRGDFIPVSVQIRNESNKRVTGIRVVLLENILAKTSDKGEIAECKKSNVIQKYELNFKGEVTKENPEIEQLVELLIPQDAGISVDGQIFKRHYKIGLECLVGSSLGTNLSAEISKILINDTVERFNSQAPIMSTYHAAPSPYTPYN